MCIRSVRDAHYRYIHNFTPEVPFLAPNKYKEDLYPVWNLLKRLHTEGKLTPAQEVLCQPRLPDEELYNLETDPFEINNLAQSVRPEDQAELKKLRTVLDQWIVEVADQGRNPDSKQNVAPKAAPLPKILSAVTPLPVGAKPNIIFILCDDLGYGDVGVFYQNQRAALKDRSVPFFTTPHIDTLARDGVKLMQHYCAAPVCAPSRASLLTGLTQGHANVRDNQFDKALADTHTLGSVLRQAGYTTAAIGKWGLQGSAKPGGTEADEEGSASLWPAYPTKRGFDFYFGYVRHKDGHFHYPKEDQREVWENNREISAGLDLCYTTDLFTARAKKWIAEQTAAQPQKPFFLYIAYDTPHAKLQNPPCAYPAGGGLDGGVQWLGKTGAMLNTSTGTMDGWMRTPRSRRRSPPGSSATA